MTIAGQDAQGRPVLVDVSRSADNTQTQVRQSTQVGSNVETKTMTVNNATRQITTVTTETAPGQISIPASSPATSTSPGTATDTPMVTTDPTKQPVLQFPDDYARENTMQRTATAVENLMKPENVDDPAMPDAATFENAFFKDTFTVLKGWQLPGHTSQCPVGSFSWNSTTYAIDAHCQLVNDHFNALQAAMTVVWSLLALFIVLRA